MDQRFCENVHATWDQSLTLCDRGLFEAFRYVEWHSPCGCTLGTENHAWVILDADSGPADLMDLIVSGPSSPHYVSARFQFDVEGTAQTDESGGGLAYASFYPYARIWGATVQSPCGQCTDFTGRLTSTPYEFPVNTPVGYEFYLYAYTLVRGGPGAANATAHARMHFPIGEPVFLLPDGYTVNCPTLNIVDNYWLGPSILPGDANCDGAINGIDIGFFAIAIIGGEAAWLDEFGGVAPCEFERNDVNGDGVVSVDDIGLFVQLLIQE
jgi:hypothetical protein